MDSSRSSEPSSFIYLAVPILLTGSALIFGFRLGQGGFGGSEGHRVIPAWEMLDTGDFLTQRMFETIYVRKPPGYSWAIAASTSLFGHTEWAARLVGAISSTGMVFLAYFFAKRWFGSEGGLWAGAAMMLTPLLWKFGRSAEIEPLNNFFTVSGVLLILDLTLDRYSANHTSRLVRSALLVMSIVGLGLVKGPASIPCILGAWASLAIVEKRWKSLLHPWAFGSILVASTILVGLLCWITLAIRQTGETPVTQDEIVGFSWSLSKLPAILAFGPTAILEAAPVGFLLLLAPWSMRLLPSDSSRRLTAGLAWTVLVSLGIFSLAGMTNPRYAMPATLVLPVMAGTMLPAWRSHAGRFWAKVVVSRRGWVTLLASLWLVHIFVLEARRESKSGRDAGRRLARILPDQAEVWSDSLIEARPETLLYARSARRVEGKDIHVKWVKQSGNTLRLPPKGAYLILRTDDDERNRFANADLTRFLERIGRDQVYKFEYDVYRVINDVSSTTAFASPPEDFLR